MDWLGESGKVVAAAARLFEQIDGGGLSGEQKDFEVWDRLREHDCQLDTGDSRHDDVGDEECGGDCICYAEGGHSVVRGHGDEAGVAEDDRQGVRDDLFVVDDEDDWSIFRWENDYVFLGHFFERNHRKGEFGRHGRYLWIDRTPVGEIRVNSFVSTS